MTMTQSQRDSLMFQTLKYGMMDTYNGLDGSIITVSDKFIGSIGVRGGIILHIDIIKGKFYPNGVWAKK